MEDLSCSIQKASKMAEETREISTQHSSKIARLMEREDYLTEQMVILNNKSRFLNLKLRGLSEKAENSTDVVSYLTSG